MIENKEINQENEMKIDYNLIKKIFDECVDDLIRLKCLNHNQTYTGEEVEELFKFFKTPFISKIIKNSSKLIESINDIDSFSRLPSDNKNSIEKSKNDKIWDPGEPCCSHSIDNSTNSSVKKFNNNRNNDDNDDDSDVVDIDQILEENAYITEDDDEEEKSTMNTESLKKRSKNSNGNKSSRSDSPQLRIPSLFENNESFSDSDTDVDDDNSMQSNHKNTDEKVTENMNSTQILNNENIGNVNDINNAEISIIFDDDEGDVLHNTKTEIDNIDENDLFYNEKEKQDIDEQKEMYNEEKSTYLSLNNSEKNSINKNDIQRKTDKLLGKFNSIVSSDSDDNNYLEHNKTKSKKCKITKNKSLNQHITDDDPSTDDELESSSVEGHDESIIKIKKKKKKLFSSDNSDNEDDNNENELKTDDDDEVISIQKQSKTKKQRKRIISNMDSSDDNKTDNDNTDDKNKLDETLTRKKLRKVLDDENLRDETKSAEKAERDRRKRIEEKQKLYNEISIDENNDNEIEKCNRLILDIDNKTKKVLVEVEKRFLDILKPHQIEGIKFLFNSTIESVDRLLNHKHQSGCILAHSMGLGKTLQVVVFLQTIMKNEYICNKIKRILIIVPLNVARNWRSEFEKWLLFTGDVNENNKNRIELYETTTTKSLIERVKLMKDWQQNGGIFITTITLFSQLVNGKKFTKKQRITELPIIRECLLNPGPDMVIVDEGHLLKNDKTTFNNSISQIKTLRRIILTGTPLQNNLFEYFIMVDFVKPNLLGSKREFKNRFENPINNGQHIDSTPNDVQFMKRRVHVLHQKLKDVIHRHDYTVLVPYLKPKYEFVLTIKLTSIQVNFYKNYLKIFTSQNMGKNLLKDFMVLRYIWNHPTTLIEHYRQNSEKWEEDSLDDFIVSDDSEDDYDYEYENSKKKKNKSNKYDDESDIECIYDERISKNNGNDNENDDHNNNNNNDNDDTNDNKEDKYLKYNWWKNILESYEDEYIYRVELSSKFILLFSILEECEKIGDKILLFSQSLHNLDLIEKILYEKNKETNIIFGENILYEELVEKNAGVSNRWIPNIDYSRIDGKVDSNSRNRIIENFNDSNDHRSRLMLISTKAGSLGINLVGANRCIVFDVSWNPTHDLQAIYRIFRYGQSKPVYIYRFISYGTMEQKIYDRQIIKQSMSLRVIDEHQITRYFKQSELSELYTFIPDPSRDAYKVPPIEAKKDRLLCDLYENNRDLIVSIHQHDSLLENRPEENLSEEERRAAWEEFQRESENRNNVPNIAFNNLMNNKPNLISVSSILHQQHQQQQSLQSLLANNFLSKFNDNSIPYYKNLYPQMEEQMKRQEFVTSSSSTITSLPSTLSSYNQIEIMNSLRKYFTEMTYYLQQNAINDCQKYQYASIDSLKREFDQKFNDKAATETDSENTEKNDDFPIKFYVFVYMIYLYLYSKYKVINPLMIQNMAQIKNKIIRDYNLQEIALIFQDVINSTANNNRSNQQKSLPTSSSSSSSTTTASKNRPKTNNKKIECIELDSD